MRDPKMTPPLCCDNGNHLSRFLVQPDSEAEQEIIGAYQQICGAVGLAREGDVLEFNSRMRQLGPDAQTWAWVRQTGERLLGSLDD